MAVSKPDSVERSDAWLAVTENARALRYMSRLLETSWGSDFTTIASLHSALDGVVENVLCEPEPGWLNDVRRCLGLVDEEIAVATMRNRTNPQIEQVSQAHVHGALECVRAHVTLARTTRLHILRQMDSAAAIEDANDVADAVLDGAWRRTEAAGWARHVMTHVGPEDTELWDALLAVSEFDAHDERGAPVVTDEMIGTWFRS